MKIEVSLFGRKSVELLELINGLEELKRYETFDDYEKGRNDILNALITVFERIL